jgi:hypothetical protein
MNQNVVLEELEKEIAEAKKTSGQDDNFEIEVTDDSDSPEEKQEAVKEDSEEEYSGKVQKRIKKLVDQRREAEIQSRQYQEETAQLKSRLERLEQGNQHQAENQFNTRYKQTRAALSKAVEEGDTEAQVSFSEQLADMRAAMRVAEMQKQMAAQQAASPTVGRAQQAAQNPAPQKAMGWWEKNRWFNSNGYERETAAARAIDVQLDLEGFDKDSDDYYNQLDFRLRNVFPELNSGKVQGKPRAKSRAPVAPTAGGSGAPRTNGRTRMTQDQLRMARELGITDEKGLKQYAAEIQKQARS